MPGPRNCKTKRKAAVKKDKARSRRVVSGSTVASFKSTTTSSSEESSGLPLEDEELSRSFGAEPSIASSSNSPPLEHAFAQITIDSHSSFEPQDCKDSSLPPQPCIHDPGNGPRVRDLCGFLESRFAAQPSWENWECMTFHHTNVLEFLEGLLPFEMAVILWYNKTRENARICPACRRFYRLGEKLYSHPLEPKVTEKNEKLLEHEQGQSGLCSFLCFSLTTFHLPNTLSAWGKLDAELDPDTREWLNQPEMTSERGESDEVKGFGMFLKLTRLDDPGFRNLRKACEEADSGLEGGDGSDSSAEWEAEGIRSEEVTERWEVVVNQ